MNEKCLSGFQLVKCSRFISARKVLTLILVFEELRALVIRTDSLVDSPSWRLPYGETGHGSCMGIILRKKHSFVFKVERHRPGLKAAWYSASKPMGHFSQLILPSFCSTIIIIAGLNKNQSLSWPFGQPALQFLVAWSYFELAQTFSRWSNEPRK